MNKLSPNAKHELIVQNFNLYCQQLLDSGRRFPTNQMGNVNVSKVAEICGSKRGAFEKKGSALNNLLVRQVQEIGLEAPPRAESFVEPEPAYKIGCRQNLARALEKATAEIERQRETIVRLEAQVRQFQLEQKDTQQSMEMMLNDGKRRFIWE